jgi:hypothetical protein
MGQRRKRSSLMCFARDGELLLNNMHILNTIELCIQNSYDKKLYDMHFTTFLENLFHKKRTNPIKIVKIIEQTLHNRKHTHIQHCQLSRKCKFKHKYH